jgi:hypothetical protein
VSEALQLDRQLSAVAWRPRGEMSFEQWRETGKRLGLLGRASQWWIGDWINFGASTYGDRWQETANVTGYDTGTLMNMARVAGRIEYSRRREQLDWSHHEAVAGLSEEEQDDWLAQAAEHGWSVKTLRSAIKRSRAGKLEPSKSGGGLEPSAAAPAGEPGPAPLMVTMRFGYRGERELLPEKLERLREQAEALGFEVLKA